MVTEQIPRKQPTLGFHWVLADRLMMGLKVQHAPGHTWVLWAWGRGLPHCLHRLSKQGRQHITSEAVWDPSVYQKKKINTKDGNPEYAETWMFCKLDFSLFLPHPNSDKINPVVSNVLIFVSRTHSNRIWSCQNIPKKISCWVWSLLHSCESETGRRNLLQICNFLATVRMQILLL